MTRGVRGLGWCGLGCNPTQTANIRFKFQKNACNAAIAGAVYSIWMARNDSKWNLKVPRIQCLVKMLKENVRRRIFLVMPKKVSSSDRSWFNTL